MALDLDKLVNDVAYAPRHFAEPLIYAPGAAAPFPVNGIFDEVYTELALNEGEVVSSTGPRLSLEASACRTAPLQGDTLQFTPQASPELRGRRFDVSNVSPDGLGGLVLVLNETT